MKSEAEKKSELLAQTLQMKATGVSKSKQGQEVKLPTQNSSRRTIIKLENTKKLSFEELNDDLKEERNISSRNSTLISRETVRIPSSRDQQYRQTTMAAGFSQYDNKELFGINNKNTRNTQSTPSLKMRIIQSNRNNKSLGH